MTTITTKLIKDGNSMAVRLPKALLEMSGLHGRVELQAGKNQILIKVASHPRADWEARIADTSLAQGAMAADHELKDWDSVLNDGLEDER